MATLDDVDKRLGKLEARVDSIVGSLNRINTETATHIKALEKRFSKLDRTSTKMAKVAEPKKMERSIMEVVDRALKAYDKHKK